MSARFEPPTLKARREMSDALTAVQAHKPEAGENTGRIRCPRCGSGLRFVIQANGISRGHCNAAGCLRWAH